MNRVGAVASSAGTYMYIHVYMYIMLYDTYILYIILSVKSAVVRTTKSAF